ncbi:hypothetical protein FB567DRAFT_468986 [Paraphoma chrysanthemicola]|uniref:Uncharacterized protein n=1 Tax=Paraphoma chrysanthemicola TaxID=798071 RepID=A0A8K0R5V5_9PLEO|nr:hypothetical protein FB567DRAFT_468986 [Paraphoma chrysanthemicola]
MAQPALPDDILHLLCEELADQDQFDTLFNCACSSRVLAVPALTHLYRSHHKAPVRGGGDDLYSLPPAIKLLTIQRWSILWRSIIASALDATLFPYCRYIKSLDFRDLGNLLDEDQFRNKGVKQFFAKPLKQFEKTETFTTIRGKKLTRLKNDEIIDAIGEVVTQHTPMLEVISGELLASALVRWTPRLPRLQSLELFNGKPLEDELMHASIYEHCPQLKSLMIYTWTSENCDEKFAKFLSALRPNSLAELHTIRDVRAGAETFLALSQHAKSLDTLKLCVSNESAPFLSNLAECTALKYLSIEDLHGLIDLEATQNDVFLKVVEWLTKCENLKHLLFPSLQSGAAIAMPVLLERNIRLEHLELDNYTLKDHKKFHQALVHQKDSLKYLSLSGDTDGMFRDDLDALVDSLKQLYQLRVLKLILPEVLSDQRLVDIINNLSMLEDLFVNGLELNDVVLDSVATLPKLKSVTLSGISKFTVDGLLKFVGSLGPGNAGIRVTIDMADPDTLLPQESIDVIASFLADKTGGTFDYIALRDPKVSEWEGESD